MSKKKTRTPSRRKTVIVPKKCFFCEENKLPWFSDTDIIQRYLTERGKIIARTRNGLCATHQRRLTIAIKHARHLAMLPFLVRG